MKKLSTSGVDLANGGGFEELHPFQEHLLDNKTIVYDGLSPDRLIFSGNFLSDKILYLLYGTDKGDYVGRIQLFL